MVSIAAASYALALADVAKSNNTLEATSTDVEKIDEILPDRPVFDFFANPTIEADKKKKLVEEITKSSSFQAHTRNFQNILVDGKMIGLVKEIAKEFKFVYNTLTDIELAVVSSAVKVESQHLAQIKKQVQKLRRMNNVRVKIVIDPSLVVGFTIRKPKNLSPLKVIKLQNHEMVEEETSSSVYAVVASWLTPSSLHPH